MSDRHGAPSREFPVVHHGGRGEPIPVPAHHGVPDVEALASRGREVEALGRRDTPSLRRRWRRAVGRVFGRRKRFDVAADEEDFAR
jgi:hypothetical protein